jgi:3-hydroxybutyryl-CoA dehydrogenase
LKICDFGGIDIWTTVYNELAPDLRADAEVPAIMKAHVEAGDAGMSAGRGIHEYESIETVTAERDELMLKLAKLLQQSSKES